MLKANKVLLTITVFLFALIVVATSFAFSNNFAYAQNTSLEIDLNETSKFDVYNDVFAYTYGTSVCFAKDNVIKSFPNAFSGTCIGLTINAKNILLLAKNGTSYALYYFDYDEYGIKSAKDKLGALDTTSEIITALFKDDTGKFYFVRNYSSDMNTAVEIVVIRRTLTEITGIE